MTTPTPMRLMSWDLSCTASGVVTPDGTAETFRPPRGLAGDPRLDWWHQTFVVLIEQHAPTHHIVEQPFSRFPVATRMLTELYREFRRAVGGTPITWVPPSTLKLAWAGKGNASKDDMRQRAVADGLDVFDLSDDAVDALALWVLGTEGLLGV